MSKKLLGAFEEIQRMPYFKNYSATSIGIVCGHESAIKDVLLKHKFKEVVIKKGIKLNKILAEPNSIRQTLLRNTFPTLPKGGFICHPSGGQDFPDFLIRDFVSGLFVICEGKSSATGTPSWNDNFPKPDCIYAFTSENTDETTLALGQDLISDDVAKIIEKYQQDLKVLSSSFNATLAGTGFGVYTRPKILSVQGKTIKGQIRVEKCNPLLHTDRVKREQKVKEFIDDNKFNNQ